MLCLEKEEKETKDNEEATKSLKEAPGVSSKTENTPAASTKWEWRIQKTNKLLMIQRACDIHSNAKNIHEPRNEVWRQSCGRR